MVLLQEQSVCHFAQPTSAVLEYNAHVRAKRANTDGPTGCSTRQGTVGCNNPQHHNVLTAEIASLHGMPAKILKETELPVLELIIEQPHLHIKQTTHLSKPNTQNHHRKNAVHRHHHPRHLGHRLRCCGLQPGPWPRPDQPSTRLHQGGPCQ